MEEKVFFKNVQFDEESHTYTIEGKKAGISTTGLIHQYCKPFDEEFIAPLSAKKQNKTVEQILNEWAYKRDYACERGNQVHLYAQGLWKGEPYHTDFTKIDKMFIKELQYELPILNNQALNFYEDYKDSYEFVEEEQFLYDANYDIAGSIDLLLRNKKNGKYAIADFKTYGELHKKAYNKFLIPLHKFDDNNVNHLSFQLEVYKQLFERETNLIVGEKFGVWFNLGIEDYEIIETNEMEIEIKKILENRRVKGMESIPTLLYGRSGTGKTAGLRNYAKNDLTYINILDKPLPFKSDITMHAFDDYNTIIAAINKTKKKFIFIDDAGFLMTNELFEKVNITGYKKFTEIAEKFNGLISAIKKVKGGKVVVISMHEEFENEMIRIKTAGKMIESLGVIEGNFTIALRSVCNNGKYQFATKNSGNDITKTPMGMFEDEYIDNDLKIVEKAIREYYELDKIEKGEDK